MTPRSYLLTPEIVSAHAGSDVVCLDVSAVGRAYQSLRRRPDPSTNGWIPLSSDVPDGFPFPEVPDRYAADGPELGFAVQPKPVQGITRVTITGLLQQRAFKHPCGWVDGHDAIADRICAALDAGNVLLVINSPGGANAGLQEAIRMVVAKKRSTGRHVIGWANEMIGSAAYWWAAEVCDEIFTPEAGIIGCIGSRAAHVSLAGRLRKEGIAYTYFAWPGPGKVALAAEHELGEVGKARGERDVAIAGEAFSAAVCAARGLSRDDIVALDGDALTGQAAVDAGLADGVSTYDEVLAYALSSASAGGKSDMGVTYEKQTTETYEDDSADDAEKVPGEEGADEEPEEGTKPEGESEAEEGEEEDSADEPDEEKNTPPPAIKSAAVSNYSVGKILGLNANASLPSIKSRAHELQTFASFSMRLTGTRSIAEAAGALRAMAEEASGAAKLRNELGAEKRKSHYRERMALLLRLSSANIPGYSRGELLVDDVDAKGNRTTKPAPIFAEMKLGTLRGFVNGKLSSQSPTKTPFEPDQKAAEQAPRQAAIENAQTNPVVLAASQRSTANADTLAAVYAANFGAIK